MGFRLITLPDFRLLLFRLTIKKNRKFHKNIATAQRLEGIRTSYLKSFCGKFEKEHGKSFNKVTFYRYKKFIPELNSSDSVKTQKVKKWTVKC